MEGFAYSLLWTATLSLQAKRAEQDALRLFCGRTTEYALIKGREDKRLFSPALVKPKTLFK